MSPRCALSHADPALWPRRCSVCRKAQSVLNLLDALKSAFEAAYRTQFSFLMPDKRLVVEPVSVEARAAGERHRVMAPAVADEARVNEVRMYVQGAWHVAAFRQRARKQPMTMTTTTKNTLKGSRSWSTMAA